MPPSPRSSGLIPFLAIVWALWLGAIALSEQVGANEGMGWDGVRFARYATDGPKALVNREINSYYVQRVGPSLVVHGVIRVLGRPFDGPTIRWTFLGMNLVFLSASVIMLVDVARRLELSRNAQWLLFAGLFINPANGRLPVYYANIGDSTAFTLGMTFLWGYVARKPWALVLASLVAIVSWPAAFFLLAPLIVWPRMPPSSAGAFDEADSSGVAFRLGWKGFLIALPVGAFLMAASWRVSEMPAPPEWGLWTTAALTSNAWLMGLAAVAALSLATRHTASEVWVGWSARTVATALVLLLAGRGYVAATESGSLAFGEGTYWREVLLYVRTRPLSPFVGHFAYFGALAVASYALWPRALMAARRLGVGCLISLSLMGLQALDTESRRLNANWPLIGLSAVLAIQPLLSDRRVMGAAMASIVLSSKLWWRFSGPNLFDEAHEPGNYYNLQGPSLSTQAYLVHLGVGLPLLALLLGCLYSHRQDAQNTAPVRS